MIHLNISFFFIPDMTPSGGVRSRLLKAILVAQLVSSAIAGAFIDGKRATQTDLQVYCMALQLQQQCSLQ